MNSDNTSSCDHDMKVRAILLVCPCQITTGDRNHGCAGNNGHFAGTLPELGVLGIPVPLYTGKSHFVTNGIKIVALSCFAIREPIE